MAPSPPAPKGRATAPTIPRFSINKASTIEDQIRSSYYTPAPGAYTPLNPNKPENTEPKPLGKISEARLPSCLDHESKTKKFVPGPGAYSTPAETAGFSLPEGGRLNRNAPQEKFKIDEYPKPSPGEYGVPDDPSRPRQVNGKFSKDPRVTKFIHDEVQRTKHNPGPGGHDVLESMEAMKGFCPEGGRIMHMTKPVSYFDQATTLSEGQPGPDAYNLPGAIKPHRTTGRLVYRYQSATIGETRDLITRMVGDPNVAPGPGTYDLPDCPPTTIAPALKGKAFGHAMPHPFAYNCAPDTANRYSSLGPVRQNNNAAQIFGNGVKNGVIQRHKSGSASPSKDSADKIQAHELPKGLESIEEEYFDVVQWRSGGFSNMKKSRSAGALRAMPEHASVQDAKKSYKPMSKWNQRKNNSFLPGASRRSESVSTHDLSEEYGHIRRGKWHLQNVADSLDSLTKGSSSVFEPLDEDKLKEEAMAGLREKAKERMRFEGVSQRQQTLVINEMNQVLEEQIQGRAKRQAHQASVVEEAADDSMDRGFPDVVWGPAGVA